MVYVYNSTRCTHYIGQLSIEPMNYAVVTPEQADLLRQSHPDLQVEGAVNFKPVFKQYGV